MPAAAMPTAVRPAPAAASAREPESLAAADPGALARLGRLLPRLQGAVRLTYGVGWLGVASALVVWWAVAGGTFRGSAVEWGLALAMLAVLLIPAAAAWLLGLTLKDVLSLPGQVRDSAVAAAASMRDESGKRRRGLLGVVAAIWAARSFVLSSKGLWARAVTAGRLVRLARLPFVLGLVGVFLLNGVLAAAALMVLAIWAF